MKLEILQGGALLQDIIIVEVKDGKRMPLLVRAKGEPAVFGVPVVRLYSCIYIYIYIIIFIHLFERVLVLYGYVVKYSNNFHSLLSIPIRCMCVISGGARACDIREWGDYP